MDTVASEARRAVLADESLGGREFARALSDATDEWVVALFEQARGASARAPRVALLAVGGYGRGELAPFSDLDLLLVHETKPARVEQFASDIWYPLWDAGVKLGHSVRTVDERRGGLHPRTRPEGRLRRPARRAVDLVGDRGGPLAVPAADLVALDECYDVPASPRGPPPRHRPRRGDPPTRRPGRRGRPRSGSRTPTT
jgi:hypothetical protein